MANEIVQESGPASPAGTRVAAAAPVEPYRGKRLLLAEDDAIGRDVVLELLHGTGLVVDTAADGAEAVALARDNPYDLVLMDMQMPEVEGLQATRAIRALPGRAEMPIVALTANAFAGDRQACLAAGMDDHLAKPIDPHELDAMLRRWLHARPGATDTPAAPPAAAGLEHLRAAGIDVHRGMASVGGNPTAYRRVLALFDDSHRLDSASLERLLGDGDAAAADRLLHKLRGGSMTIGAVWVTRRARQLERALRRRDATTCDAAQAQALVAPLAAALGAVLLALQQLDPPGAARTIPAARAGASPLPTTDAQAQLDLDSYPSRGRLLP